MTPVYDIIFAGGGTTACVIAGRLAAANPSLKILVVESGQHSRDVPSHVQPCRYLEHLAPNSTTVHFHKAKASSHLNGRAPTVASGKGVGGGSIVNFMLYTRGAASDYNDWEAFGNKGWSYNDLLPLIKKAENFTPISSQPTHGYSGPIQIAAKGTELDFGEQFLDVARAYDPGRPQVNDPNDFETVDAYSLSFRYVDPVTGKRCDTASRYLYPQSGNPNLEIIVGKRVKRVMIENGRAVGIEYTSDGVGSDLFAANATKLVVVSAGAFGSSSILERSGIGGASFLEKNNIPMLVDLPGVGENYLDHLGAGLAFHASEDLNTMKDVWSDPDADKVRLKEWEEQGTGKVALNGIEALAKVRLTAGELRTAGPALQHRWETFFKSHPDKTMSIILPFTGCTFAPNQQCISVIYFLVSMNDEIVIKALTIIFYILEIKLYPDLKGSVHVTSGEDPNLPLDFDPDYCSKVCDIEQLTLMYKLTRELYRRLPAYRGEVAAHHPKFPPGSAATCKEAVGPVPIDAPNIMYTAEDDEAIADYHRNTVFTTCHSMGTCAMKPREQGGVVDPRLNVYGVEGLKVADLSICPSNVGNNTYSTALVIGEKAAVIIAEDLGLNMIGELAEGASSSIPSAHSAY